MPFVLALSLVLGTKLLSLELRILQWTCCPNPFHGIIQGIKGLYVVSAFGGIKGDTRGLTIAQLGFKSPGRGNWRSSDNECLPGNAGFYGCIGSRNYLQFSSNSTLVCIFQKATGNRGCRYLQGLFLRCWLC